jgi:hypothetical protein
MAKRFTLHSDESFEFGLGCLIDGIACRTTRPTQSASGK